ncbi:RNA polymerase sigma-I factor [Carboxydothermus pertinax]|uniref:RNA polymerase sigma factor SigI n=1 Tax=Carboxydothermus pertinax TaxID=870242 RepID=A0A1L8CY06_9THEO|nr:RNA polymerase sigma-I factor [Carboxydothermus pertinax]GAV23761.1 RNA polymerase sigma-I factor [Carboxydothermus pertinax]
MQEFNADNRESYDALILQHEKLIFKIAARLTGRFITKSDDEYSIGLLALHEASQNYIKTKGADFESFAAKVVRRRLIDYYRQNNRLSQNYPLDENLLSSQDFFAEVDMRLEIEEYKKLLKKFNITFKDLVKISPKHKDSRQKIISLAQRISEDDEITQHLVKTGKLSLQIITTRYGVNIKTLEKYRKYLVAIVLMYWGKFTSLQAYLGQGGEE